MMNTAEYQVTYVSNPRAKSYILRVPDLRNVRVTVPRGGNRRRAEEFLESRRHWVERQREVIRRCVVDKPLSWSVGSVVWFRGHREIIEADADGGIRVGDLKLKPGQIREDLQAAVQGQMWRTAWVELPALVKRQAGLMGLNPTRISIRNQRTRWGSCSSKRTISLNWRLIQTPEEVSRYVVIHELCHMFEQNHSVRFWSAVGRYCPDYRSQEGWLKRYGRELFHESHRR